MGGLRLPLVRSMTLAVTERCNLRCAYCYVPVTRGRTMDAGVADAAVDLLASHAPPDGTVTLSFFGGEPFLAQPTVRRASERARAIGDGRRRLRLTTTTNGLALDASALELCRASGMELAVSVDGDESADERPFAGGRASAPSLMAKLPAILSLDPGAKLIARMTVTPDNVGSLSRGVRALARSGFRRIFWLPAYEMDWSDEAVRAYGHEMQRIGEWLAAQRSAGASAPELPAWRGIDQRLTRGRAKAACGAGVSSVAVATDGRVLACYRLLSEPDGRSHELGDVARGLTNEAALALFASLDPAGLQPEDGDCGSCTARDGCTHFCPALGLAMRGDANAVPASVCRLMRAAVEGVRASLAGKNRRPKIAWAAAAMVAAASSAACGGDISGGLCFDGGGGGLCPVMSDAAAEASGDGGIVFGGVCDAQDGAPADVQADDVQAQDATDESYGGGICPPPGIC